MDIDLLKTFLEVSRTRHFGQAAESLYLTQSAVSFRIRQLENLLGLPLFIRHRNNICLTSAGNRLVPYAENMLKTWQEARNVISHTQHLQVSLGASALLWEINLTQWLQQIYEQHQNLQIKVGIAPCSLLIQQLHQHQLDLLFSTELPKQDGLIFQPVGKIKLLKLLSEKKINKEKRPYLRVEWGADFDQQQSEDPNEIPLLSTGSAQLAHQLLGTTGGYSFLPAQWADKDPLLMVDKQHPAIIQTIYAIWLNTSDKQPLITNLLQISL